MTAIAARIIFAVCCTFSHNDPRLPKRKPIFLHGKILNDVISNLDISKLPDTERNGETSWQKSRDNDKFTKNFNLDFRFIAIAIHAQRVSDYILLAFLSESQLVDQLTI
jgi:transcriptional antiterminator